MTSNNQRRRNSESKIPGNESLAGTLAAPEPRAGCKDIWNAWMLDEFTEWDFRDIPFCPTTSTEDPVSLVSYSEAKRAHKELMRKHGPNYRVNAYLHGWEDDDKYDGRASSIWLYPDLFWTYAKHYRGFFTPDFSTCCDFPLPIREFNTYRMRVMGYWVGRQGKAVINNVRWGYAEDYDTDFAGLPRNDVLAIGSVASGLKRLGNRALFVCGLYEMVKRLHPHTIFVYGSANYSFFRKLEGMGIRILQYPSRTSTAYQGCGRHE